MTHEHPQNQGGPSEKPNANEPWKDSPQDDSSSPFSSERNKVREGVNPFWPVFLFLLLMGGAIIAAIYWVQTFDFWDSEETSVETSRLSEPIPVAPSEGIDQPSPKPSDPMLPSAEPEPLSSPSPPNNNEEMPVASPKELELEQEPAQVSEPHSPIKPALKKANDSTTAEIPMNETNSQWESPLLPPSDPPPALLQAIQLWENDESKEALAVIKEHAKTGRPEAQTILGLANAQGKGGSRNFRKAIEWFNKAAKQNDGKAQYYLGEAYAKGTGVEANSVMAAAWFILSASHGYEAAIAKRDSQLAALSKTDRHYAFNRANNLGPEFEAGWSQDPANGISVWLPSWYRTGSYTFKFEVPAKDGYAHGHGKITLTPSLSGDSDRVFEGVFANGYYFGKEKREGEFHYLPSDDILYRLPPSSLKKFSDVVFWVRTGYGGDFASNPCYVGINQKPDLLISVPHGFPVLNDEAAKEVMEEGWKTYLDFCPKNYHAKLTVVPLKFGTDEDRFGHRIFVPQYATGTYYGKHGETLSINNFENHARERHEDEQRKQAKKREREQRRLAKLKAAAAAKTRGNPDIRGVQLGMTISELRDHLKEDIVEWKPSWTANKPLPPFSQPTRTILLNDGAQFTAYFTSPVNGSVLYAMAYEQNLRDGPPKDQLMSDLEAKYGKPDNYGVGKIWWEYELVSLKKKEVMGKFMKIHFQYDKASNKVEYLRIIVNDAGFGSYDERAAYEAKLQAERDAYEASKSDKPKF